MPELSHNPLINAYNMDCMGFMRDKPDNYYDLAIVDPPYGINLTSMNMGNAKFTPSQDDKKWDSTAPDKAFFDALMRTSKNQIIWGGNNFELPPSQYFAIWDKGDTMYGRDFAEAEYAWVGSGGTRIFKKSPNQLDRIHPTQKPIALYRWLLKNYAKEGDKILDTHGGSFSSAIACHMEGFDLDICELDEDYFNDAVKRFELNTCQKELEFA